MKAHCLIMAQLSFPCSLTASARVTEQQVVRYAKALDVAKLDPTLSSQRLDGWLRSGPARLDAVKWEMSDCDLKGGPEHSCAHLCKGSFFPRQCRRMGHHHGRHVSQWHKRNAARRTHFGGVRKWRRIRFEQAIGPSSAFGRCLLFCWCPIMRMT
jgi:hypothetical protein